MSSLAVFMNEFEVELVDKEAASRVGPNMGYFPTASLPPNSKIPVRVRRREH